MAVQTFQVGIKALIRNEDGRILMVTVPERSGNAAHWDLPGGRIDEHETFLETLQRELLEEIGVSYHGNPKQLMTFLTNITIAVGDIRQPLIFVVHEVTLPADYVITLDPTSAEDAFQWFTPDEAAGEMAFKFSPEFCDLVRSLEVAT